MKEPKFRWLDLDNLVEGLIRSVDAGELKIKRGDFVEETGIINSIRSYIKGPPEKRGRIPLDIGGHMGYIFIEQGIRYVPRRFERYESLNLRVKGGIRIKRVSDFKSEYSITEDLNGENEGILYEHRKDYVKDGGQWVESDLSPILLSEYFRRKSVTVTTRKDVDGHYQAWRLLLGKLEEIFRSKF